MLDIHRHQFRQRIVLFPILAPANGFRRFGVPGAPAIRAGNFHIRQKLDVQADRARSIAGWTAQFACIVRTIPGGIMKCFRLRRPRVYLPQFIMDIGIGSDRGADVDTDRRCVDQLNLADILSLQRAYRLRQRFPLDHRFQSGNQAFQNQRGLARSRHSGHNCQPALRDIHFQRLNSMQLGSGKMNFPQLEHIFRRYPPAYFNRSRFR